MKKFLLLFLLVFPLYALSQHARYTQHSVPYPSNPGGVIPFMKFVPPDYSPTGTKQHPLIIFLHGQGTTGYGSPSDIDLLNSMALPKYLDTPTATMTFPDRNGVLQSFIVLVPQKHKDYYFDEAKGFIVERQWPAYYIDEMLKYAKTQIPNVDPDRIFLTGLSVGAGMTWDFPALADSNARKFAGIVPVSGNPVIGYGTTADICNIAENKVASRGYIGYAAGSGGDSTDGVIKIDSARRAQRNINSDDSCNVIGEIPSELIIMPGYGHDVRFWNTVYDTAFSSATATPDSNMYRWMANIMRAPEGSLPVRLVYFKGKNLNDQNILQWATSRELNSDRIELLRSIDGKRFTVIATFKTNENSSADKEYSYKDNNAPKGTSHYQLRQVDRDGKSTLSRVIAVTNKNQTFVIEKYPNPVTDRLNISIEGTIFGLVELQVLDVRGNLVKKMVIRKDQQSWKGAIDLSELAKGMYMFQLKSSDGKKEVSSFIKN